MTTEHFLPAKMNTKKMQPFLSPLPMLGDRPTEWQAAYQELEDLLNCREGVNPTSAVSRHEAS